MKRNMFINELSLSSLIVYENLVFLISIFYGKKCEFWLKYGKYSKFYLQNMVFLKNKLYGNPFNLLVY